ncbi:MAG: acetyl-CoA carboxylase carboxyltransferase subunit alpha [Deferribacteraceae bacterium]|jgi:acetyl-CoA carboxylase carboxyl transferase subunit alpha|nr:acetyl-CoA carboxylase carboxyltransferase subunit alpha [Deferribacteraceae bacterium]
MVNIVALDFEAPIIEIENKITELQQMDILTDKSSQQAIHNLQTRLSKVKKDIYSKLTPAQTVQVARHPNRPYTHDYIQYLFKDFTELHGDRTFGDDQAIIGGMATFNGTHVMVIGHQKGRNTKENIARNFGMANPEGYRKAVRLMKMADKFNRPVITFVDTAGAYPGIGAEERGQAEAIAKAIFETSLLRVPVISFIVGEGGSGGAIAIAMGNRVYMLEHSIYSVISPEGCASILWKGANDPALVGKAADALKITAKDLKALNIIDGIVPEPEGGAHRNHEETAANIGKVLTKALNELEKLSPDDLMEDRYKKYRALGVFSEQN